MTQHHTVFDRLLASLTAAARYDKNDQAPPVVVLWTDKDLQWAPLATRLRAALPQLLTLGAYQPEQRQGPAIWLRCMIAGALDVTWPPDATPILYLPGVSRQDLRAVEECPPELQPLAELQYRGAFWTQTNARDWTLAAFLQSASGGLGLSVAKDAATAEAIKSTLLALADVPVSQLRDTLLQAEDFYHIAVPDPERNLLRWLDDPESTGAAWTEAETAAFHRLCEATYGFDPVADGRLAAGELLGRGAGAWQEVWARFAEAPARYSHLPDLLHSAKPPSQPSLFDAAPSSVWPQDNKEQEALLGRALLELEAQMPGQARQELQDLEAVHAVRRGWVWAELGQAPLARALAHLASLAVVTAAPLAGLTPAEMAEAYAGGAWRADAAVIAVLAAVERPEDARAVTAAISAVYQPWLQDAAARFQQGVAAHPLPGKASGHDVPPGEPGQCLLFADGLRFDVGQRLKEHLAEVGLAVQDGWRFCALPSVTPTAKPAVSPIAPLLGATTQNAEFKTSVVAGASAGKTLTIDLFRKLLEEHGYQVLRGEETGSPEGAAWAEYGSLDSSGHALGWKLARRIDEEVRGLALRVRALLEAGWTSVRVVTDHGWLLLPGDLPKAELPAYLTESKWGRCAMLKRTSYVAGPVAPWHWLATSGVAVAPGIGCFWAGSSYAHGGVSVQECVVPILSVSAAQEAGPVVTIESARWTGLRCRVRVNAGGAGLRVDIRTRANDAATTIAEALKSVGPDGTAAPIVSDDSLEGMAAIIVVLDGAGMPVARQATTVGCEE